MYYVPKDVSDKLIRFLIKIWETYLCNYERKSKNFLH